MPDKQNVIKELSAKIYDDVAHPTFKEAGNMVGNIMKFVALPFTFLGMTAEEIEKKYQKFISNAINKVQQEDYIAPTSEKVGLLLDQAKFSFNHEEMCNMFEDLLASFCDKKMVNTVHPYYLHLLSLLSPNDAHVLKMLTSRKGMPCIDVSYKSENATFVLLNNYYLPVADEEQYRQNLLSLQLLQQLNIISLNRSNAQPIFPRENAYEELLESQYVIETKQKFNYQLLPDIEKKYEFVKFKFTVIKHSIEFTDMGEQFIKCCIRDAKIFTALTAEERQYVTEKIKQLCSDKSTF